MSRDTGARWFHGWRGWLLVFVCVSALLGLAELVVWTRWSVRGQWTTIDLEWHANGRLACLRLRQARLFGSELVLHLHEDGTVDHERSFHTWRGLLRARPLPEHVALFTSNATWGAIDGQGIGWTLQDHFEVTGALPATIAPHPGPRTGHGPRVAPDRWGRPYLYVPPIADHPARITTLGRDGTPGGEGDDADWTGTFRANGEVDFDAPFGLIQP